MAPSLQLILVLLAASVAAVVACRLARLPPIVGYLVVGMALGPHAMAWVPDTAGVRFLAEFGIVFLMFSIGLEFSLGQLRAMRRAVFGLGFAQVVVTTLAGIAIFVVAGFSWQAGLVFGGAFAMSSTAIVTKLLAERMELGSAHGRDVIGILLFQDLAVVAFLILIPSLGDMGGDLARALGLAAAKAAVALTVILYFGQRPMRAWFHLVVRQRSSELFMLNLLLMALGLAALTEIAGLSLALGAFLAGMLIAETEYRYQVDEDIKPFRDVLLGLFFVTVGMSLDLADLVAHLGTVLALLAAQVAIKLVLIVALARAFGAPFAAALRSGFYLAQAGEFALVLLALAAPQDLVPDNLLQAMLAAMILSMLAAPLLIQVAEPVVRRFAGNDWLAQAAQVTRIAASNLARQEHVIVCGYGRSGQNLVRLLERLDIPYLALDSDPARVREAADGGSVVYGDARRREVLLAAGLAKARAVAITFADTPVALRILDHVKKLRPELPVIVRTVDDSEIERLAAAGATEVVPEVLEGSLMLATHSLLVLGVPLHRVLKQIRLIREEHYSLFRGFFHGATDAAAVGEHLLPRLHSVNLPERAWAVGRSLPEIALAGSVEVTGVRRRGARSLRPDSAWTFEAGDTVVLLGDPESLAVAEARLLEG